MGLLRLLGEHTPEPLAKEFRWCGKQLQMGLALSAVMQGLLERVRLYDLRILATTLIVHRQAGGNVVMVLERLRAGGPRPAQLSAATPHHDRRRPHVGRIGRTRRSGRVCVLFLLSARLHSDDVAGPVRPIVARDCGRSGSSGIGLDIPPAETGVLIRWQTVGSQRRVDRDRSLLIDLFSMLRHRDDVRARREEPLGRRRHTSRAPIAAFRPPHPGVSGDAPCRA